MTGDRVSVDRAALDALIADYQSAQYGLANEFGAGDPTQEIEATIAALDITQ